MAGGIDDIIKGLGYDPIMVKQEIPPRERVTLLSMPTVLNGDLTKAARSHSRRLAHASRGMARSMVDGLNFMVVSCPCSPAFHVTVYGVMVSGSPEFDHTCNQGCSGCGSRQKWRPVRVGVEVA